MIGLLCPTWSNKVSVIWRIIYQAAMKCVNGLLENNISNLHLIVKTVLFNLRYLSKVRDAAARLWRIKTYWSTSATIQFQTQTKLWA